ncbi:hypothetical protein OVA24_16990 [Luteolibacter sp. SL250]|uniref:hypothetical protein n=1 Tax=Luteolibacter sp. SL250 TaxID=2995170 RepID=UPI0022717F47|nr:hypothetical protein [Luteolibacter sp. SL250]WAC18930.1 hypothetical protein OVA24_16990 [Luteolibacter sp. SL250]
MDLDAERVTTALKLVGRLLTQRRQGPFHLVVCGGSALVARGLISRSTIDVDLLANVNHVEGEYRISPLPCPMPAELSKAARDVAGEMVLKENWLNADASWVFPGLGDLPEWFWLDVERRAYGMDLTVDYVSRRGQIFLKTYAVLNREQERDVEDLLALAPDRAETLEAVRWVLANMEMLEHRERLPHVLGILGHEDIIAEIG